MEKSKLTLSAGQLSLITLYFLNYGGYLKIIMPQVSELIELVRLGLVGLVIVVGVRKKIIFKLDKYTIGIIVMFVALFTLIGLSYFKSTSPEYAKLELKGIFLLWLYVVAIVYAVKMLSIRELDEKYFMFVIKCNVALIMIYTVFNMGVIITAFTSGTRIGNNVDSNPIWIARFCCETALLMCIANVKKIKKSYILALILIIMVAFATGSRGPIISLAIILMYYFFVVKKYRVNVNRVVSAGLLVLGIAVVVVIMLTGSSSLLSSRFSFKSMFVSSPGYRMDRYIYTIRQIVKAPINAQGLGSWGTNYWNQVPYFPWWYVAEGKGADYPHNIILELWYESGVLAVIAFAMVIWFAYKKCKFGQENKIWIILWCVLLLNIAYSMFSGDVVSGNRGIYYTITMIFSMNILQEVKKDVKEEKNDIHCVGIS